MDCIVEMRFGAHLYGTETVQSDLALKAVYLPDARDIPGLPSWSAKKAPPPWRALLI